MSRLTEKRIIHPSCTTDGILESREYIHIENKDLAEKKLFELENIEDGLGVGLITFLKSLTPGNPVWFYTYDDELHDGWVDFIECNQRDGWTVSMHYKPANKTGSVYTARLWKYSLEEYGKRFACTKEELE